MLEQPFSAVECWIDETRTVWATPDSGMTRYVRGDFHNDLAAEVALLRAELAERDTEQPRTDAEWKAADRKKRINDLAARYAGEMAGVYLDAFWTEECGWCSIGLDYPKLVFVARALAAAVVEAEE